MDKRHRASEFLPFFPLGRTTNMRESTRLTFVSKIGASS